MSFVLLGILNSQAAGGAALPAYDLLQTTVLTSSQNSITWSNLDTTYGADYTHLQIRAVMRQDRAVTGFDRVVMQINGDTAAAYAHHQLFGNGSSTGAGNGTFKNFMTTGISVFNGDTSGAFGVNVIDINDAFNTSKYKTVKTLCGAEAAGQKYVALHSGVYYGSGALSSIKIFGESSSYNCLTGSRFSLYGWKASA